MNLRTAERVLTTCLGHREGEPLLVVTDSSLETAARHFVRAASPQATLVSIPAQSGKPPEAVAAAIRSATVAVLLTSRPLSIRRQVSARIASIPAPDLRRLAYLLDVDYEELKSRGQALAAKFRPARHVRIRSSSGTDLSFEIAAPSILVEDGDLRAPGAFGTLPAGELRLALVEGTAAGVLMVDGSIGGIGLVPTPVMLVFDRGRAVEIADPRIREALGSALVEFGIGTNPRAEVAGTLLEDRKALGSLHVSVGSAAPLDLTLRTAEIELDGTKLPAELLSAPTARPDFVPGPSIEFGGETYRLLFEHANDAQYILDLETQIFVDVNPAFERLTGYTRDEVLSGRITAPKIVARESMTTYLQKRETRRIQSSERYDLRVLCKNGEKKPVEISVQRVRLQDRDVVIGSMRDLTARKRLEQEMWEKIEELGYANSRIYALTEKIRRVPEMTPQLLPITDECELLERAARFMGSREGLGYASVDIWLTKEDALELRYTTGKAKKRRLSLSGEHRLVRTLKGLDPGAITKESATLCLQGHDRAMGVLEVEFHRKEIEVLEGNERALKGYQDLLETLSSVLGLLVENLHLYETVRMQSLLDQLTGVFNRRCLDSKLAEEIQRARRYGRSLSFLMVDLDRFKEVNDVLGHNQGDRILAEFARLLRSHTREVDAVCRFGGDEFAILMPETPYDAALTKAETLRAEAAAKEFSNPLDPAKPVRLTLSIGVTAFTPDTPGPDELLRRADEALYEAKRAGRNRVCGALAAQAKP